MIVSLDAAAAKDYGRNMSKTITPNAARVARKADRDARSYYAVAVTEFRAAMTSLRSARASLASMPVVDFRVAIGLAGIGLALTGTADQRQARIAANRAWRNAPTCRAEAAVNRAASAAEEAMYAVCEARSLLRTRRRVVREIDSGEISVVTGAAWSDRGLRNVQNANGRR